MIRKKECHLPDFHGQVSDNGHESHRKMLLEPTEIVLGQGEAAAMVISLDHFIVEVGIASHCNDQCWCLSLVFGTFEIRVIDYDTNFYGKLVKNGWISSRYSGSFLSDKAEF